MAQIYVREDARKQILDLASESEIKPPDVVDRLLSFFMLQNFDARIAYLKHGETRMSIREEHPIDPAALPSAPAIDFSKGFVDVYVIENPTGAMMAHSIDGPLIFTDLEKAEEYAGEARCVTSVRLTKNDTSALAGYKLFIIDHEKVPDGGMFLRQFRSSEATTAGA